MTDRSNRTNSRRSKALTEVAVSSNKEQSHKGRRKTNAKKKALLAGIVTGLMYTVFYNPIRA